MHCQRYQRITSRREMLLSCANGFGAVALAGLFASENKAAPHYSAKANAVIFLYMDGGPSQLDTFDYKPKLAALWQTLRPRELEGAGTA
jgi:hypothetical protein